MFFKTRLSTALRLTPADITLVSLKPQTHTIAKLYQQPLDPGIITTATIDTPKLVAALRQIIKLTRLNQPVTLIFPDHPRPFTRLNPIFSAATSAGISITKFAPTSTVLASLVLTPQPTLVLEIRGSESTAVLVDPTSVPLVRAINNPEQIIDQLKPFTASQVLICGEGATPEWRQFLVSQLSLPVTEVTLPPVKNLPPFPLRFAVVLQECYNNL